MQWSCLVTSTLHYGSVCGVFDSSSVSTSVLSIPANSMSLDVTYEFNLVVSSADGRTASQTVVVTPAFSGSARLSITSTFTRFSPSNKLVLNAQLSADYAVNSTWTVSTELGVIVPIESLTSQSKVFSFYDASNTITYPLSVGSGVFYGGKTYTFRLSVSSAVNARVIAYAEIVLTANAPPTSGYLISSPTSGNALITEFLLSSPGWTADAACFPMSYGFSYRLSKTTTNLTVSAASLRAFTTTTLPAGLSTLNHNLILQAQVTDIFNSFSTATTTVRVTLGSSTDVLNVLTSNLRTAFAIGDVNLAIVTVNNVSQSLRFR